MAKILALTLLGALVSGDSSGSITLAVYATGLPERVLQDLVDTPHELLIQVRVLGHGTALPTYIVSI